MDQLPAYDQVMGAHNSFALEINQRDRPLAF